MYMCLYIYTYRSDKKENFINTYNSSKNHNVSRQKCHFIFLKTKTYPLIYKTFRKQN